MHSSNDYHTGHNRPPIAHSVSRDEAGGKVALFLSEAFAAQLLAELRQAPHTAAITQTGRTLVAALNTLKASRSAHARYPRRGEPGAADPPA